MRKNKKTKLTLLFISLTIINASQSLSLSQESEHSNQVDNKSKPIYFGYLIDAPPVSMRNDTGESEVVGYCGELFKHLKLKYKQRLKEAAIKYEARFQKKGFIENELEVPLTVECGPNTISKSRIEDLKKYSGKYSISFFTSGAKLLLKRGEKDENLKQFNQGLLFKGNDEELAQRKIVIIDATTTNNLIENIYPRAPIVRRDNRQDAVKEFVKNPNVIAYASDEILLHELMNDGELLSNPDRYVIVPRLNTFSEEEYGVVVYKNDDAQDMLRDVDNWLFQKGEQIKKDTLDPTVRKTWLDDKVSRWNKGNIDDLWFSILIVIFLSIFFAGLIYPLLVYILVTILPRGFFKWLGENRSIRDIIRLGFGFDLGSFFLERVRLIWTKKMAEVAIGRLSKHSNKEEILTQIEREIEALPDNRIALDKLQSLAEFAEKPNDDLAKAKGSEALSLLRGLTAGMSELNALIKQFEILLNKTE